MMRKLSPIALLACVASSAAAQRQVPSAVQHYFSLVRPIFSGQNAYDQTAFMDQYFRWPGNTGFNASIRRVEETLKAAGYVEESKAAKGAVLTYRSQTAPLQLMFGRSLEDPQLLGLEVTWRLSSMA